MQEICYYLADDGKRFDNRWECIRYERKKKLEDYKEDFVFYDYNKCLIPPEEARASLYNSNQNTCRGWIYRRMVWKRWLL